MTIMTTENYVWDFALSEGDTLLEKGTDLLDKVMTLCVRQNGTSAEVHASKEVLSMLTIPSMMSKHKSKKLKGVEFVPMHEARPTGVLLGEVVKSCGSNGYCCGFEAYENNDLGNEIHIRVKDDTKILKVFNFA